MNVSARVRTQHRSLDTADRPYVTYPGYVIDAPGYDADGLDRAVQRALSEGVRLETTDRLGAFRVSRSGSDAIYTTSRTGCSCKAGRLGTACKHRALVCLLLAVVESRQCGP